VRLCSANVTGLSSAIELGHYFLNCSDKPSKIWFDSEAFAKVLVEHQQKYGFDGILVNLPGRPPDWTNALASREQIDDREHLCWKSGSETIFGADDNPQTYQPGHKPLARADYTSIDVGNPATYRLLGYVWNTWHAPELWGIDPQAELSDPTVYPTWFTNTLTTAQQLAPEVSIHVEVFSPFTKYVTNCSES